MVTAYIMIKADTGEADRLKNTIAAIDGVVNAQDYAPRDGSVQSKGDLRDRYGRNSSEDEDGEFLVGAGVGAAVSLSGVGLGYVLWGRATSESDNP